MNLKKFADPIWLLSCNEQKEISSCNVLAVVCNNSTVSQIIQTAVIDLSMPTPGVHPTHAHSAFLYGFFFQSYREAVQNVNKDGWSKHRRIYGCVDRNFTHPVQITQMNIIHFHK